MKKRLRILNGGLQQSFNFNKIKIIASPEKNPPEKMDVLVFEEDTFLIMSDEPEYVPPEKHPIRLMKELSELKPESPGSIVLKGKNPIRILAVVHDVTQDPTWKEEWIEKAMCAVFQKCDILQINSLGLPMLGTKHGRISNLRFISLLARCLQSYKFSHLKILWLITPVPLNEEIISVLKKELIQ